MSETTNTIPSLEEARAGAAASSAALADAKAQVEASSAALAAAKAQAEASSAALAAAKNLPRPASTPVDTTPIPDSSPTDVTPTGSMSGAEITGSMLYGSNAAKEANSPIMRLPPSGGRFAGNALIYFPNGDAVNVQQGIAEANLNYAKSIGVNINSRDDYNKFVIEMSKKASDPFSIEAAVTKQGSDLHQTISAEQDLKTPEEIATSAKEYNQNNLLTIKNVGTPVAAPLPENFEQQMGAIKAAQAAGNLDEAQNLLNTLMGQADIPPPIPPTPDSGEPENTNFPVERLPSPTPTPPAPAFAEGITTTPTPPASGMTGTMPTVSTPAAPQPIAVTPTYTPTVSNVAPNITGTVSTPLQTAGLSAVPKSVQVNPNVTGTTMADLTSQSQRGFGGVRKYRNDASGLEIMISVDAEGKPLTMVPPGYVQVQGQSEGGSVSENSPEVQLARRFLGFKGPSSQLENFLNSSPALAARMGRYRKAMASMSSMRMGAAEGTDVTSSGVNPATGSTVYGEATPTTLEQFQNMQRNLITQTMQPLPSLVNQITPQTADFIPTTAGQTSALAPMPNVATVQSSQQAVQPTVMTPGSMTPDISQPVVSEETAKLKAPQGIIVPGSTIDPKEGTSSLDIQAAQGNMIKITGPEPRKLQTDPVSGESEIISGVANAQTAKNFTEAINHAEATPTKQATVQGQLEGLMAQFEGGNTPSWAAGAMRAATSAMIARGIGASSMAGQAIVQAAMESALPIAQADASVVATFEAQNLSNRQQRVILAAQQRAQFIGQEFDQAFQARVQNAAKIADVANMNFTAEQQIALEDSRAANTMELSNLTNRQAGVMAESAAIAQLDMANLSNRQQAAVQNAQNFLQMDLTNLSNTQQTELFKTQQNIQSMFTDQAARNASEQFNATSKNQTDQFFANLSTQTSQFNASQQNAMDQFNVSTTNAMRQFNSETQQQRDLFNAQNGLVIAQANAQWRQNLATVNNAAINQSNMDFAKTINQMSMKNLDEIWQRERDLMSFAFTSDQSAMDRALQIILGDKELEIARQKLNDANKTENTELAMRFLFGTSPGGILGML